MASKEAIEKMIKPSIESMGYEFVGADIHGEGRATTIRVYIDKPGGVNADDCGEVSHQISAIFDVEEPYTSAYRLEVSSPGLCRPLFTLADFKRFVGEKAKITLSKAKNGQRHFTGTLGQVREKEIILQTENQAVVLDFQQIEKANLAPEILMKEKKKR